MTLVEDEAELPPVADAGDARHRILGGIVANAIATGVRIGHHLILVPILFAFWPSALIGVWLMISAFPAYLSLTASGLGAAGGNAIVIAAGEGRRDEARAIFMVTWAMIGVSSVALLGAFAAASSLLITPATYAGAGVSRGELAAAMLMLCGYIFALVQLSALEVGFRYAERYPLLINLVTAQSVGEIAATALVVANTRTLWVLPLALAAVRLASVAVGHALLHRIAGELYGRVERHTALGHARALWRPSLGFMASPVVTGLNLQGYTLLIGSAYGPVALAAFAATRTLARLLDNLITFAYATLFFEMSYVRNSGREAQRRLTAAATSALAVLGLAFAMGLLVFGGPVQRLWTHGETRFVPAIALALVAAGIVRALSVPVTAVVSAENRLGRPMAVYLAATLASFAAAAIAAHFGAPIWAVAAIGVLAELGILLPALLSALRLLDYPRARFAEDVARVDRRLAEIARIARGGSLARSGEEGR